MVGTGWRRAAALGAAAAVLCGCGSAGPRRPALRHHEVVAQVELVEEETALDVWPVGEPAPSVPYQAGQAPGGLLEQADEALWYPFEAMQVARGAEWWAVMVGWAEGSPEQSRLRPKGIWVFDPAWQPVGWLDARSVVPGQEVVGVAMAWDGAGRRLAAWIRTESTCHIGLVDLPSGRLGPIVRLEDVHKEAPPAHLFWRDDVVIFCYAAENEKYGSENVFLEIDPASGETRTIVTEEGWDPSRGPMDKGHLSRDGRYVAFDRFQLPSLTAMGGRCSGIWLLDLESGECVELTYEDAREYHHRLIGWEGRDKLLFTRGAAEAGPTPAGGGAQDDLYRVHLAKAQMRGSDRE